MLPQVQLLDEMDEGTWVSLQGNLTGLTEEEADWRLHPEANNIRWMIGHLTWFEEWAHDALALEGRYHIDTDPTAFVDGTMPELLDRFAHARARYRARLHTLREDDLTREISFFARANVTGLDLLETHALHLAGHRFQVRMVRGTHARAHGAQKSVFDPW